MSTIIVSRKAIRGKHERRFQENSTRNRTNRKIPTHWHEPGSAAINLGTHHWVLPAGQRGSAYRLESVGLSRRGYPAELAGFAVWGLVHRGVAWVIPRAGGTRRELADQHL